MENKEMLNNIISELKRDPHLLRELKKLLIENIDDDIRNNFIEQLEFSNLQDEVERLEEKVNGIEENINELN